MIADLVLPASRPECDADRADQRLPHHWPFEQREAAPRADRFQDTGITALLRAPMSRTSGNPTRAAASSNISPADRGRPTQWLPRRLSLHRRPLRCACKAHRSKHKSRKIDLPPTERLRPLRHRDWPVPAPERASGHWRRRCSDSVMTAGCFAAGVDWLTGQHPAKTRAIAVRPRSRSALSAGREWCARAVRHVAWNTERLGAPRHVLVVAEQKHVVREVAYIQIAG